MNEPAGSLDKTVLKGGKNAVYKGVDAASLARIEEIAVTIDEVIDQTVETVVRAKLRIGRLLNEAREVFPGDKEFGVWRRERIPNMSPQEAGYCMRAANMFKDAPNLIETVGWSAIRELTAATPYLVNSLEREAKAAKETGEELEDLSARKARQFVQDEKSGDDASDPTSGGNGSDGPVVWVEEDVKRRDPSRNKAGNPDSHAATGMKINHNPPLISAEQAYESERKADQDLVDKRFVDRLSWFGTTKMTESHCYMLFGMDPLPAIDPNADMLTILLEAYLSQTVGQEESDMVRKAYDKILSAREK